MHTMHSIYQRCCGASCFRACVLFFIQDDTPTPSNGNYLHIATKVLVLDPHLVDQIVYTQLWHYPHAWFDTVIQRVEFNHQHIYSTYKHSKNVLFFTTHVPPHQGEAALSSLYGPDISSHTARGRLDLVAWVSLFFWRCRNRMCRMRSNDTVPGFCAECTRWKGDWFAENWGPKAGGNPSLVPQSCEPTKQNIQILSVHWVLCL